MEEGNVDESFLKAQKEKQKILEIDEIKIMQVGGKIIR